MAIKREDLIPLVKAVAEAYRRLGVGLCIYCDTKLIESVKDGRPIWEAPCGHSTDPGWT